MKKLTLFASAALLSLCAGTAFAEINKSSTFYYFTQKNPTVHEQFSCLVTGASDSDPVSGLNRAEMITGFSQDGLIKLPVSQVNSVYFDAYHDPNKPSATAFVYFRLRNSGNTDIQCYAGKSAPGDTAPRTQMPGPYGVNLR